MDTRALRLIIESKLENVSLVGTAVQQVCLQANFSESDAFQVQLAIVEAVNNVIKHAYDNAPGHDVEIGMAFYDDKLVMTLTDTGKTLSAHEAPTLEFDPDDIDALPESGMGLFIIHSVMDDIAYQTCEGRNVQTFVKYLAVKN